MSLLDGERRYRLIRGRDKSIMLRASLRGLLPSTLRQPSVKGWRQQAASRGGDERKLPLLQGHGGELQCREHVCVLQIRVVIENLVDGAPGRKLSQDSTHCHPRITDTGQATHPAWVDSDPLVRHASMLALANHAQARARRPSTTRR
jgi:hypothetical protein